MFRNCFKKPAGRQIHTKSLDILGERMPTGRKSGCIQNGQGKSLLFPQTFPLLLTLYQEIRLF
jgi:hypothetical protein